MKKNETLWKKIIRWIKKILVGNKNNLNKLPEVKEEIKIEQNEILKNAREAFRNYVLNYEENLGKIIYENLYKRIEANKDNIEKLIKIKKSDISYSQIIEILEEEKNSLEEYKKTIKMTKIDNKFLMSEYQVPVGIIGVETDDINEKIKNIFKAIFTRNAIVIIEEKEDNKNVDKLILLITKEMIKKFNIDENIIQIVEKEKINKEDKKEFDKILTKQGEKIEKQEVEKLYIYQENEYFEEVVKEEVKRLRISEKIVEVIKEEKLEDAIRKINKTKNYGVSIYSQNRKKGYEFINLINSNNVFFNGTLLNAKKIEKSKNAYYTIKNILCENLFI